MIARDRCARDAAEKALAKEGQRTGAERRWAGKKRGRLLAEIDRPIRQLDGRADGQDES